MEDAYDHGMGTPPPAGAPFTPHSQWHSPVPYLFGGLAAMLGLIAFALMILACSYWKLSGHLDGSREEDEGDLEAGTCGSKPVAFEEKILVIMAGEVKPTFLATPVSSRSSSFGNGKGSCSSTDDKAGEEPEAKADMNNALKQHEGSDQQSH